MKQNFDRFISCKTTIDDVHKRLREAELGSEQGSGEASTGDVVAAVAEVGACRGCKGCTHHMWMLAVWHAFRGKGGWSGTAWERGLKEAERGVIRLYTCWA